MAVKYDKCGEGSLGISAYAAMRDALNRTGRAIFYDAASIDPLVADAEMPYLGNSVGTWSDIKSEWCAIQSRTKTSISIGHL